MLSAHPTAAQPGIAYTTPEHDAAAHYSQLDDAHRIERVVRRLQAQRGGPEAPVEYRDFCRAEETCHLTRAEIEALMPEVTALLAREVDPLAVWDIERRRALLATVWAGLLPTEQDLFAAATAAGFTPTELNNLWGYGADSLARRLQRTLPPTRVV